MNRFAGIILVRLALACAGGVTFLALAMLPIKEYLPADHLLIRQLHFTVSAGVSYTPQQWRRFAREQQSIIEQLARENITDLATYTEVLLPRDLPTITVRLRCPSSVSPEYIDEGLEKLLRIYAATRAQIQPAVAGENEFFNIRMTPDNLDQLKEYTEQHARLLQQKNELQLNRRQLNVQNLELNQSLDRGPQAEPDGPLAEYIKPQLDRACSIDAQGKQLLARLRQQQKLMANLEFHTSRSQSNEQTSQLHQQMQKINEQCLLLQSQISQRRLNLAQTEIQRVWYLYEAQAQKKISQNQQLLEQNQTQLQQIEDRLTQTQNTLNRLDPLRQTMLNQDRSSTSDDDETFASAVQLKQMMNEQTKLFPFSRAQQILMGLAALTGFCLGLLIPFRSDNVTTKMPKSAVASPENQRLEDFFPGPNEKCLTDPITPIHADNHVPQTVPARENPDPIPPIQTVHEVINEQISPPRPHRHDSFLADPSPILSQFYSADRKINVDAPPKTPQKPLPEPQVVPESKKAQTPLPVKPEPNITEPNITGDPDLIKPPPGTWWESIMYVRETDTNWLREDQPKPKTLPLEPETVESDTRRADDLIRQPEEPKYPEPPEVLAEPDNADGSVEMMAEPVKLDPETSMPVQFYLNESDLPGDRMNWADPDAVQLYINQDDLKDWQTTHGAPASDEPLYLYFYIDRRQLPDHPPVPPTTPDNQKKKDIKTIPKPEIPTKTPVLKSEPMPISTETDQTILPDNDQVTEKHREAAVLPESDQEAPVIFVPEVCKLELMTPAGLPENLEYVIAPDSAARVEPPILCYQPTNAELPADTEPTAKAEPPEKPEAIPDPDPIKPLTNHKPKFNSEPSKTVEKPAMSENVTEKIEASKPALSPEHQALLLTAVDMDKHQSADLKTDSPYERIVQCLDRLRHDHPCPIILISSLVPEELSPRFAVNLGLALVTRKLRVLLIEADQTSRDLTEVFEMTPDAGFFEWRRGEIWASKAIHDTMMPNLSFMASGTPSDDQNGNQTDLNKESHRWSNLRRNFDTVLLYSPGALSNQPVTPDQPMGLPLLDIADGVLGLTRLNQKPPDIPQIIKQMQTILTPRQGHFLGLIALY